MGIANWLGFTKAVTEPVKAVGSALDGLFTSDEERLSKKEIIERTEQNPTLWQRTLDLINANSKIWFVAAARPFNVWLAGVNFLQMGVGMMWFDKTPPDIYVNASTTAFLGALGLYGVLRTMEKTKGKDQ